MATHYSAREYATHDRLSLSLSHATRLNARGWFRRNINTTHPIIPLSCIHPQPRARNNVDDDSSIAGRGGRSEMVRQQSHSQIGVLNLSPKWCLVQRAYGDLCRRRRGEGCTVNFWIMYQRGGERICTYVKVSGVLFSIATLPLISRKSFSGNTRLEKSSEHRSPVEPLSRAPTMNVETYFHGFELATNSEWVFET